MYILPGELPNHVTQHACNVLQGTPDCVVIVVPETPRTFEGHPTFDVVLRRVRDTQQYLCYPRNKPLAVTCGYEGDMTKQALKALVERLWEDYYRAEVRAEIAEQCRLDYVVYGEGDSTGDDDYTEEEYDEDD